MPPCDRGSCARDGAVCPVGQAERDEQAGTGEREGRGDRAGDGTRQLMGALLALASAAGYGIADFTGGLLSRRADFVLVALAGQAGGLALTLVAALLPPAASPDASDLLLGALSGVGTGLGMVFLYRGLSRGAMSVVVPVSAVGGVACPYHRGGALGDRPSSLSWLGIATAVPALWLVSRDGAHAGSRVLGPAGADGLVAGAGIALQYVALARTGADAGIWPVTVGRLAAILVILPAVLLPRRAGGAHSRRRPAFPYVAGAVVTGMIAALALVAYLLAVRRELVTVAVVLSSLYPVIPVVLGVSVLRERPAPLQAVGLAGAAAAVVLLTAG